MKGLRSIFLVMLCASCLERYTPSLNEENLKFLVVDGSIDSDGSATVHLARSIPLSYANYFPSERGAVVTIETSSGKTFNLIEGDSATYAASNLDFEADDRFTLHIKTKNGREYESDAVQSYPTPPIDNVSWNINPARDLLEIRVDANDTNPDATGLYLWDCIETYQYHAAVYSGWKIENGTPRQREPNEVYYWCWRSVIVPAVMLNANYLTVNNISKFPIVRLVKGDDKLSERYSLLIKQRAISQDEYAFRSQLQNSTEQQGTLFSVIPGAVVGNVHSTTDPGEYVLGYFSAQDVKERRIFIDYNDLPHDFQMVQGIPGDCSPKTTCNLPADTGFDCTPVHQLGEDVLIASANLNDRGSIVNFTFVTKACGDCRYYGGDIVRPAFWE